MRILFALMFVCLAVPLAAETKRHITVNGQADVAAQPDMATIQLGVTKEAEDATEALNASSKVMTEMLGKLTSAGVELKDIQTSDLNLSPVYSRNSLEENGAQRITGFRASNTLRVHVRNLDNLGEVIGLVTESGANQFYGLTFGLKDTSSVMNEARRAAVADARAKADLYSEAAQIKVGDVLSISETVESTPMSYGRMEMAAMSADSVPIAEGELNFNASVIITYGIAE